MKNLTLLGMVLIFICSCEKEEITTHPTSNNNYFPLEIGNYWIYQQFKIDSLGREVEYPIYDSTVVSGTELINGEIFFIIQEFSNYLEDREPGKMYDDYWWSWNHTHMLRDSSGYLIDNKSIIHMSNENFQDTLYSFVELYNNDTLFTSFYKMEVENSLIEVPAGSFESLNFKGTTYIPNPKAGVTSPKYSNTFYSKGIGKVKATVSYISSNNGLGRKLIRYHIKQ